MHFFSLQWLHVSIRKDSQQMVDIRIQEVEIHDINGINFTMPTDYEVSYQNETQMDFEHDADNLSISVVKDAKAEGQKGFLKKHHVLKDSVCISGGGYLVDDNGTYTFSYGEYEKLAS